MTVTVLLFASYADQLGTTAIPMEVGEGATVGDLVNALRRRPGGEHLPATPLVALNQRYASAATTVASGDEVALIPPVAGG